MMQCNSRFALQVICMEAFKAKDVTQDAHEVSRQFAASGTSSASQFENLSDAEAYGAVPTRRLQHIHSSGGGNIKVGMLDGIRQSIVEAQRCCLS